MSSLKEKAGIIKRNVPAIFMALKKKETPVTAKIMAAVTVCYALSPIDLVPDFIPVLGYLDDIMILPFLIALTVKLIPQDIFERCKIEAENLWKNGKPRKWYYALPIIVIWLFVIGLIIWTLVKWRLV